MFIDQIMEKGKYVCTTTDYRVLDNNDDLVFIATTHTELLSDDEEINSSQNVEYCDCGCKYYKVVL